MVTIKVSVELPEAAKEVADFLKSKGTELVKVTWTKFERAFAAYLKNAYERYSVTKTLLYKDKAVPVHKIFVPLNVKISNRQLEVSSIHTIFGISKRIVLTGTAGSGKSILCKWVFVELVKQRTHGIPIFVELRLMTNEVNSLIDFILSVIREKGLEFDSTQLDHCLKAAKFSLILDGFDEVSESLRGKLEKEILKVSAQYPDICIVVSSRPDDCFASWTEFATLAVQPLNKKQAIDLLNKLDYDKDVKNKFIRALEQHLFEKHKDFASNPLLLTILLLTYKEFAEIPEKIHIFFEQAFDVLFFKHDAMKAIYKREMHSHLALDDFKRVLSAFSLVSYLARNISFNKPLILTHLEKAKSLTKLTFSKENYLKDLLSSVCVLVIDGTQMAFAHRSFQEYFAALYIANSPADMRAKIFGKISSSILRDNVVDLMFEINRTSVEKEYFLPNLTRMVSELGLLDDSDRAYASLVMKYYGEVTVRCPDPSKDVSFFVDYVSPDQLFVSKLIQLYRKAFPDAVPKFPRLNEEEAKKILKQHGEVEKRFTLNNLTDTDVAEMKAMNLVEHRRLTAKFLHELRNLLDEKYKSMDSEFDSVLAILDEGTA